MKRRFSVFILIVLASITIVILFYILSLNNWFTPLSNKPPEWNGFVIGKSTEDDIINTLGKPTKIENRNDYLVYRFEDDQKLRWHNVEFWISVKNNEKLINGILLYFPVNTSTVETEYSLSSMVTNFGKPNVVNWAKTRNYRFLAWAVRGIAIEVDVFPLYNREKSEQNDLRTDVVFLFQPMTDYNFGKTKWPWPPLIGWSPYNINSDNLSDSYDGLPKDPFLWP